MRIRATRVSLALALAAVMAVAAGGTHAGARFLERPATGTAAAAHATAAGLPGLHGLHAHQRVSAVDVVLAPATLLAMLLLAAVVVRRSRPRLRPARSAADARAPPASR